MSVFIKVYHGTESDGNMPDNPKESFSNTSVTATPGVFMAVHDPTWKLKDVIDASLLQVASVDANAAVHVNLGLKYYEYLHGPSIYQYG